MRGVPLRTVQELLGHKTGQMTLRYTHLSTPHLQEAVTILETALIPASDTQPEGFQK
jgi:site-specific recombinase XerD